MFKNLIALEIVGLKSEIFTTWTLKTLRQLSFVERMTKRSRQNAQ
jgi:hypothetical protein